LRSDLDQDAVSHSARLRLARSETEAPFNWIRSLPRRPSTSSVHSGTDCVCGATSSTNAGGAGCRGTSPVVAMRRFKSSHATCNSLAVRLIPSFRATSTAANQSSVGIRAFPIRLFLHSSKRPFTSSKLINHRLATSHGPPPRRISGGRMTLTVIDPTIHASLPKTHSAVADVAQEVTASGPGIKEFMVLLLREFEVAIDIAASESQVEDALLHVVCGDSS
jgi:hypothetical protein